MHVSYGVLELSGFVRYGASSVASEGWVSADFGAQLATCTRIVQWYSTAMRGVGKVFVVFFYTV